MGKERWECPSKSFHSPISIYTSRSHAILDDVRWKDLSQATKWPCQEQHHLNVTSPAAAHSVYLPLVASTTWGCIQLPQRQSCLPRWNRRVTHRWLSASKAISPHFCSQSDANRDGAPLLLRCPLRIGRTSWLEMEAAHKRISRARDSSHHRQYSTTPCWQFTNSLSDYPNPYGFRRIRKKTDDPGEASGVPVQLEENVAVHPNHSPVAKFLATNFLVMQVLSAFISHSGIAASFAGISSSCTRGAFLNIGKRVHLTTNIMWSPNCIALCCCAIELSWQLRRLQEYKDTWHASAQVSRHNARLETRHVEAVTLKASRRLFHRFERSRNSTHQPGYKHTESSLSGRNRCSPRTQ